MGNWVEINEEWGVFKNSPLCRPGMLVEIDDKEDRFVVIGHVNPDGGVCSHCDYITMPTTVLRAKVLWSEPTPPQP